MSIVSGQSAWKLLVDVYCIDHDGNVLDAALTSIMAALKTLQLPATSVNETDHVVSIVPRTLLLLLLLLLLLHWNSTVKPRDTHNGDVTVCSMDTMLQMKTQRHCAWSAARMRLRLLS